MTILIKKAESEKQVVICPVELDLIYQVLDPLDQNLIREAAECLAETFTGVEIDGVKVSEPVISASNLSIQDMFGFLLEYLNNAVHQGLCLIAREKEEGRVVGVLACKDFNPEEETQVFEGNLEPMNDVYQLLADIDERFLNTIQNKTGKKIEKNEYIYVFMGGARLAKLKRFVVIKLFEILINIGTERGYKGMFGEVTNPRSERMCIDYCGFHLVYDTFNNPILASYSDYEKFKMIPPEISTECKIVYRALNIEHDI